MRARVSHLSGPLCAQTALIPHLPYGLDLLPLFDLRCAHSPEALTLVAAKAEPYPLSQVALDSVIARAERQGTAERWPGGYVLIRGLLE